MDGLQSAFIFGRRTILGKRLIDFKIGNGQWCAKFMAGIGDEALLTLKGNLQTGKHIIKSVCKFSQLIAPAQVDAAAQVALFDALRGMRDRFDRAHRAISEPHATGKRNQQHQQTAEDE